MAPNTISIYKIQRWIHSIYLLLIFFILSLLFYHTVSETNTTSIDLDPPFVDFHEVLSNNGIPRGILPDNVRAYSISSRHGRFVVKLKHPCYSRFKISNTQNKVELVYYAKRIKGKLNHGSLSHITGIQVKKLFLWFSITGLEVEPETDMILFHVGTLTRTLPAQIFDTVPSCSRWPNNSPRLSPHLNLNPLDQALSD